MRDNRWQNKRRTLSVLMALLVFGMSFPMGAPPCLASAADTDVAFSDGDGIGYAAYLAGHEGNVMEAADIPMDIKKASCSTGITSIAGMDALSIAENDTAVWRGEVPQSGWYYFVLQYYNGVREGSLQISLSIDGETPFKEASGIALGRRYEDIGGITQDVSGVDIRPKSQATEEWLTATLADAGGLFGPMRFYLEAGSHEIGIKNLQGELALSALTLTTKTESLKSYDDYRAYHDAAGAKPVANALTGGIATIEAEALYQKSDISLYPQSDVSSPLTSPFEYGKERLNSVGGTKWQSAHQWISWRLEVPESGYYQLGLRFRQNISKGMPVTRCLYINGEIPFDEARSLTFTYDNQWQGTFLAINQEPCLFYLPAGSVEIRLEVTLGQAAPLIVRAQAQVDRLAAANRQLLTLLGTEPDLNRDYRIKEYMPEIPETFADVARQMDQLAEEWEAVAGDRDELLAQMDQMVFLLEKMANDPSLIPKNFTYFRDSLSNLASQIIYAQQQPLLLDCLYLAEKGTELPRTEMGFWEQIGFEFLRFIYSYITDYDTIGSAGNYDKQIEVWLGNSVDGGRDQARILRQLVNEYFSAQKNIAVDLRLVPAGTIQTAMMSGRGPDVALQLGAGDPVEYAARNAVLELSSFPGYADVIARFPPSALEGFTYNGGVYALPQSISYPIMIYRSDILNELGIDVRSLNTWDDIIGVLPTLQMNHIDIGLQATINTYFTFLYQKGGQVYSDNRDSTRMNERVNLDAFAEMMHYYTDEGLPYAFSFENRLRTGEMAFGIVDIATYNLLQISAPEIKGKWAVRTVPGMLGADGLVNRSVPLSATGAVIMSKAADPQSCWEFLCWLTEADTQYRYGMELESTLGSGARYNTANLAAMELLPWKTEELNELKSQIHATQGIIQVPGSYMVTRNIEFAIKNVYNNRSDARQVLRGYVEQMNTEIARKRRDLGLDN